MDIEEINVRPLDIIKTLMSLIPSTTYHIIENQHGKLISDLLQKLDSNLIGKTVKIVEKSEFLDRLLNDTNIKYYSLDTFDNIVYYTYWVFDEKGEDAIIKEITKDYIKVELNGKIIKIWKTPKS